MDDFEKELKLGFLEEAAQSLADVEQCFLSLETDPTNAENLNKIFRLAHNLKGSSKAVGFDEMGAFTHEFETFILKIKNQELVPSPPVVNLLFRCNDHLKNMVDALKGDLGATFDSASLLEEMKSAQNGESPTEAQGHATESEPEAPTEVTHQEAAPEVVPSVEPEIPTDIDSDLLQLIQQPKQTVELPDFVNEDLIRELEEKFAKEATESKKELAPAPEQKPPEVQKPIPETKSPSPQQPPAGASSGGPQKSPAVEESIRVAVSKVELLLNSIGEMVILQSVMREQVLKIDSLVLRKTVHQMGKVSKEIQDLSMSLRMVPVKPTFQKMQRIVRDTAQALAKDVGLKLSGEDTELDKTVLEKINDPLVHLIRNSVDHGIEGVEVRTQRGKPAKGQVNLSAFHRSGKLVIEVSDDGGGIDPERLKKKALEKGIIKAGVSMTEKEVLNLIFAPGFSTKEQVTDVSGRGVGMDVVKTNIQDLGGEIQIESVVGKGSVFRIILPLTLAIIDGMVVTYGAEKFVIPLGHVHETLQPKTEMIQQTSGLGDVLMIRGDNLPIFRLGDFFGLKSKLSSYQMIAMVFRTGNEPYAILVDDIIGQFQVVVKQLGPELQGLKGVSGSTILGDGKPALIIEPLDLTKRKLTLSAPSPGASVGGKAA